jgi:hypothetical protein
MQLYDFTPSPPTRSRTAPGVPGAAESPAPGAGAERHRGVLSALAPDGHDWERVEAVLFVGALGVLVWILGEWVL